jgi:hypothetical protein
MLGAATSLVGENITSGVLLTQAKNHGFRKDEELGFAARRRLIR